MGLKSGGSAPVKPMAVKPDTEAAGLRCSQCAGAPKLELALRVEREAEAALFLVACPSCGQVYRWGPGGVDEIEPGELALGRITCPHCRSVGYAMLYDAVPREVEIYTILTCQVCRFTFRSDVERVATETAARA